MKSRGKRTVFLGTLATAVFVWAAIYRFDVPPEVMGRLLLYCVLVVLLTMLAAALCVGLVILARLLFRRLGGRPPE
jgi:ABC-type Co2+ transport system permease subunit